MSLIDRLHRTLLARLHRDRPAIVVEANGVRPIGPDGTERHLGFSTLTSATVHHRDVYAADAIVLRLVFSGSAQVEIFQDDPQWEALVAALDESGRTITASAHWQVQSIADGPSAPPRELMA